ncbi:hypothetical protein BH20ACI3_BH20ACI3_24680 [soil metagenome]
MKPLIVSALLLLILVAPALSQDEPKVKANWKLITQAPSYYFFVDLNMVKETDKGTLVAFQMRMARSIGL